MCDVDYVDYVLEVDVVISADESHFSTRFK